MPIYQYKCDCGKITEVFRKFSESEKNTVCVCGNTARRIISLPNLVTDANFGYTGKVDPRLGNTKIEGRKDFWNRVKRKGLREIDLKELDKTPSTFEERIKKPRRELEKVFE